MREIKVRGYAVEEMVGDQWLYGTGVRRRAKQTGVKEEWFIYTDSGWERVRPESIGQYTGLKDKNGKDVYEGDVIRSYNEFGDTFSTLSVVVYDESYAKYTGFDIECGDYEEVIGNIFENLELLQS